MTLPPTLLPNLASPTEGTAFTDSRIFVSGRAEDDIAIAEVEVAIVNAAGQYMSSNGDFGTTRAVGQGVPQQPRDRSDRTTPTPRRSSLTGRTGSGSGRSTTTTCSRSYREVNVTVTAPAGNVAPVADAHCAAARRTCARSTVGAAPTRTRRR